MGLKKISIEDDILQIQVGAGLTLEQWASLVHPQSDGYVTVATKDAKGNWTERNYPSVMWAQKLIRSKDKSCYVSVNSFFKPMRNNANARQLNAFYVDLDHYKDFLPQEEVLNALDFLVKTDRLPEPSMIIDSGRGLYGMWLIESVPAKFKHVQRLYSHIEKHLISVLKDYGGDPQASDIARVLKAPSTYNHITGRMVTVLRYNQNHYTMRYMQQWFNESAFTEYDEQEIIERKARNKSRPKTKKLHRLRNFYTRAIARSEDLAKLCEMRDYKMNGYRNALIHIYAYQMFLIHNNYYVVRSKVVELNDKLTDPIPTSDLVAVVKSCLRAYEGHREDPTKGYRYKTVTIVEKLDITVDEQRQMQTLIHKGVKQERNTVAKREKRRGEDGLTAKQRETLEMRKKVQEMLSNGFKQKDIALAIGKSKSYTSELVKSLKNEGK